MHTQAEYYVYVYELHQDYIATKDANAAAAAKKQLEHQNQAKEILANSLGEFRKTRAARTPSRSSSSGGASSEHKGSDDAAVKQRSSGSGKQVKRAAEEGAMFLGDVSKRLEFKAIASVEKESAK